MARADFVFGAPEVDRGCGCPSRSFSLDALGVAAFAGDFGGLAGAVLGPGDGVGRSELRVRSAFGTLLMGFSFITFRDTRQPD
jgi:hypothetical protein